MYWKGKGFTRFMSGLSNLNKRLQYFGGDAEGRLQQDKLRGLKRALFNSYQACTVELEDGREFKCLINPNKNTTNYDNKILSIPYEDICLNSDETVRRKTSEGIEEIGICPGDIVFWKETNSYWLVFLEYLEEDDAINKLKLMEDDIGFIFAALLKLLLHGIKKQVWNGMI